MLAYLAVLRTLTATQNLNFVPSLLLLGSTVAPAAAPMYAASRAQQPKLRPSLIAAVTVAGGVIGTIAAGTVEFDVLQRLDTVPMLAVGPIVETSKLLVPVLVLLVIRPRQRADGVVIGIASGAGFAALETIGYGFTALLNERSLPPSTTLCCCARCWPRPVTWPGPG